MDYSGEDGRFAEDEADDVVEQLAKISQRAGSRFREACTEDRDAGRDVDFSFTGEHMRRARMTEASFEVSFVSPVECSEG